MKRSYGALTLARLLFAVGIFCIIAGALVVVDHQISWLPRLGRLPGDLHFQRGNTTVVVPIVTAIIVSVVLSLILTLIFRR